MWDIKIECKNYYVDFFKSYFIVNNLDYTERDGCIIFYVDTVDKFFTVVTGLNKFFHEHRKPGMESFDFVVDIDESGDYCLTAVRYAEY